MALLEVRGVAKSFRTLRALEGVDVDVQAGTFHGLIGPNGSGKSTLLKAIAGAHFADGGTIVFDGHDITRATPYERARLGLSLKFQITAVLPELSVYDNVLLAIQSGESVVRLLLSSSRRALRRRGHGTPRAFPPDRPRRRSRRRAQPRPAAVARDRHGAGAQAQAPAARRADRRHEPGGAAGDRRPCWRRSRRSAP